MRTLMALLIVISIMSLNAQDWLPFNSIEGNIQTLFFNLENPYYTMAGTDNGLYIDPEVQTEFVQTNLPVVGFAPLDDTHCLFIMGDGSWSDGIYQLDLETNQQEVAVYSPWPYFLEKDQSTGIYYAGAEYGLYTSEDGITWDAPGDDEGARYDIAFWNTDIAICGEYCIYHSADGGDNWNTYTTSQQFTDLAYNSSGTLYGVFDGVSNSSGLWSSQNNGQNWTLEFYSDNLHCVNWNWCNYLFVGWNPPVGTTSEGIAMWHPDIWELEYMNSDLPNLQINSITFHPLIDCENVIACTEDGVYMNTTFPYGTEEVTDPKPALELYNYPNPFNPETTIRFTLERPSFCEMSIYNARGQRIARLIHEKLSAGPHTIVWNAENVSSGIYTCRVNAGGKQDVRRLALIK